MASRHSLHTSSDTATTYHEPVYKWQEDVENLERYSSGGYHPVHLGDTFANGRYKVVHKLGFGSYSTVWLARDELESKYVALKIIVACCSTSSSESSILRRLKDARQDEIADSGGKFVLSLLDEFFIDGPNGRHRCLVTEPAACNLADSKEAGERWMFPLPAAYSIVAQIVQGVAFMHRCGVVHADLYSRNIMFRLENIDGLSIEELYTRLEQPRKTPVRREDGRAPGPEAPEYTVLPAFIYIPCHEVKDPAILICDLGEAFLVDEGPSHQLCTPLLLCPPEMIFADARVSKPADIWTLACTIYEVTGERDLFEALWPDRVDIGAEHVSTLGKPPAPWWDGWKGREDYFLEDGTWNVSKERVHESKSRPLELRVEMNGRALSPEYDHEDRAALAGLLRGMLRYDPEKRATIDEIMGSTWMRVYGKHHGSAKKDNAAPHGRFTTEIHEVHDLPAQNGQCEGPQVSPKKDHMELQDATLMDISMETGNHDVHDLPAQNGQCEEPQVGPKKDHMELQEATSMDISVDTSMEISPESSPESSPGSSMSSDNGKSSTTSDGDAELEEKHDSDDGHAAMGEKHDSDNGHAESKGKDNSVN